MKKVFFSPAGKIHPSQYSLIENPPEGYEFIIREGLVSKLSNNSYLFNKIRLQILDRLMPLTLVTSLFTRASKEAELTYNYNNIPSSSFFPFVVNVEWANVLIGRSPFWYKVFRRSMRRVLETGRCRHITTWTDWARQSVLEAYGKDLDSKITVVPPATTSKAVVRKDKEEVIILFVGTTNLDNDFEEKGGRDVLKVFKRLRQSHKNIRLVVRAKPPKDIDRNINGVTWITSYLSKEEMDSLYRRADIFFFPTHLFQNTILIEAMSYRLPILTTHIGASDYVIDGKNGFLVSNGKAQYWDGPFLIQETTKRHKFIRSIQDTPQSTLDDLTYSLEALIDNPDMARAMGEVGKAEVDEGRFSIKKRNEVLKEIFDAATSK